MNIFKGNPTDWKDWEQIVGIVSLIIIFTWLIFFVLLPAGIVIFKGIFGLFGT